LGLIVSDEGKKFYNIDTWWQSYETFLFANDAFEKARTVGLTSFLRQLF
jgi:hypothetical protein